MTNQRAEGDAEGGILPIGFAALAAMPVSGAVEDGDLTEGNERLKDLPDHENDHLRETEDSEGAGVPSIVGAEAGNP